MKNGITTGDQFSSVRPQPNRTGYHLKKMSESIQKIIPGEDGKQINLKNPILAGFLAWLFPGLGHFYQGRKAKAALFAVCILPIFLFGCYLGSDKEYGVARNVYCLWQKDNRRLFFIPQAPLGLAAIPALIQNWQSQDGGKPFWNGAFAPPSVDPKKEPTLDQIIKKLQGSFEIGTIFTVVAGLMNLLAIFDAVDGPVFPKSDGKKEEEEG